MYSKQRGGLLYLKQIQQLSLIQIAKRCLHISDLTIVLGYNDMVITINNTCPLSLNAVPPTQPSLPTEAVRMNSEV